MSLEQTACEDLKAFERRLTEVIGCLQPATIRWRILLVVVSICTAVGAWYWLTDPALSTISFSQSLWSHLFFTISCCILGMYCLHSKSLHPGDRHGKLVWWFPVAFRVRSSDPDASGMPVAMCCCPTPPWIDLYLIPLDLLVLGIPVRSSLPPEQLSES